MTFIRNFITCIFSIIQISMRTIKILLLFVLTASQSALAFNQKLEIWKLFNDKSICFSSVLLDSSWLNEVQLKTLCLKINGVRINDIMLFRTTDKNTTNSLVSYAWSKKYGLVQYTFQDGTTFTRIDIGNH